MTDSISGDYPPPSNVSRVTVATVKVTVAVAADDDVAFTGRPAFFEKPERNELKASAPPSAHLLFTLALACAATAAAVPITLTSTGATIIGATTNDVGAHAQDLTLVSQEPEKAHPEYFSEPAQRVEVGGRQKC